MPLDKQRPEAHQEVKIDAAEIQPILDRLRASNLIIRRVQPVRPTLEDLFIAAVQSHSTHAGAGADLSKPT